MAWRCDICNSKEDSQGNCKCIHYDDYQEKIYEIDDLKTLLRICDNYLSILENSISSDDLRNDVIRFRKIIKSTTNKG